MAAESGRRRRASALLALATLLALAAFVAACSASPSSSGVVSLATASPSDGASAAPSESVDPEVAIADFEACMKEHGVDVHIAVAGQPGDGPMTGEFRAPANAGEAQPNGGNPGDGPDQQALEEADQACRHLLPSGMMGDPDATMDPEMADKLLDFSKCMRDHGIDFPDPQFDGGGVRMQMDEGMDPSSQAFKDAQEACGDLLPGGGPGTISGAGPVTESQP
jgi:hypothetical protein